MPWSSWFVAILKPITVAIIRFVVKFKPIIFKLLGKYGLASCKTFIMLNWYNDLWGDCTNRGWSAHLFAVEVGARDEKT